MLEKTVLRVCQSRKFGGETVLWGLGCCELFSQTITKLSGSWQGKGRRRTELMTEKSAVFAPMPRARVRTATAVKPGDLRSMRVAKHKSCHNVSTKDSQLAARTTSFVTSRFPRSKRTARSASLRLIPCFLFSSAAILRKPRTSSSNSPSTRSFRNSDRTPLPILRSNDMVRLRLQDSGDSRHLFSPFL